MIVVSYEPGFCGDIVTAVLDSRGYELQTNKGFTTAQCFLVNRNYLKQPCLITVKEYDEYLEKNINIWNSLSSHRRGLPLRSKVDAKHILIVNNDPILYDWSKNRIETFFGKVFNKNFNDKFTYDVLRWHNKYIPIELSSIIKGDLIPILKSITDLDLDENIYKDWINLNASNFPI